jgi:RNA polymerase sigma factor (sigma-70 family)
VRENFAPTTPLAAHKRHESPRLRAVDRPVPLADAARLADLERERLEVEAAQRGDRSALAALLRRHGPVLYRSVLLPRLGSEAAAQEALSATYAKVLEKLDRFTWQSVGIYPWLRMVALRIALDMHRKRRREIPFDVDDLAREVDRAEAGATAEADAQALATEDATVAKDRVERAMASINPRYAKAIRMRILEERSREDVARELEVTTATFDVVLHRAMAAMRKALSALAEEAS